MTSDNAHVCVAGTRCTVKTKWFSSFPKRPTKLDNNFRFQCGRQALLHLKASSRPFFLLWLLHCGVNTWDRPSSRLISPALHSLSTYIALATAQKVSDTKAQGKERRALGI